MSSRDTKAGSALSNGGSINDQSQRLAPIDTSTLAKADTQSPATLDTNEELHQWIRKMYFEIGFHEATSSFIGWPKFVDNVVAQESDQTKHTQLRRALEL
jgi:hypothetical protein